MNRRRFLSFVAAASAAAIPFGRRLVKVHGSVVYGKTFYGGTPLQAGTLYVNCMFQHCLFYRADLFDWSPIRMEDCRFEDCAPIEQVCLDERGQRIGVVDHMLRCHVTGKRGPLVLLRGVEHLGSVVNCVFKCPPVGAAMQMQLA